METTDDHTSHGGPCASERRDRASPSTVGPSHAGAPATAQVGRPTTASPGWNGGHAARGRRLVISTRTNARFDPLLPFEVWQALGAKLGTYTNASSWWLGDWLVFGRDKYGRRYREAIAATGLDYQTLRNYAVVARRFEPARRRHTLTFQHHAEVCALPDDAQEQWLDRAATNRWSRNELRRRLRSDAVVDGRPAKDVVRLAVPPERAQRWRDAAQRSDAALREWMVCVLDAAADAPRPGSGSAV
jgi:hypothetical protein